MASWAHKHTIAIARPIPFDDEIGIIIGGYHRRCLHISKAASNNAIEDISKSLKLQPDDDISMRTVAAKAHVTTIKSA